MSFYFNFVRFVMLKIEQKLYIAIFIVKQNSRII